MCFKLVPSKFLTQNEIDAANLVHYNELNVQNQQQIMWPAQLTVSQAYMDQLDRSKALPTDRIATLRNAVEQAEKSHLGKKDLAKLQKMAPAVEADSSSAKDPADAKRMHALAQILRSPAA